MKMIILIIGVTFIVGMAAMSIIIPQLMIKTVAKRVEKYKYQEGIPVEQIEAIVLEKRCKSLEEGKCKNIRKADDCEILFQFSDGVEKFIDVPYGLYMQVKENTKGTLYLQMGEYRDFREIYDK